MGGNMAGRLVEGGHTVFVWNRTPDKGRLLVDRGARALSSLQAAGKEMAARRAVWIMLPAGEPTESALERIAAVLSPGDILVDVGTSGGIWGRKEGYCLMAGGEEEAVSFLSPALQTLAPSPERGWGRVGPSGSGHFVKMVHNVIEYGMMQAYAEGFEILRAKKDFGLALHQKSEMWRYGSVVRSWLLDLTTSALAADPSLAAIQDWVADSGEGRWTVQEAIDLDVPAPVISLALWMRFRSRQDESNAGKLPAAMRQQFGGHAVRPAG